jgi:hypothetical protein
MATIYKVESKAYLQELIQYLYGDGYDWFDGVSLLNQERIDSVWSRHKAELGIYISDDDDVYDGTFDGMVQNSNQNDTIIKVLQEVHDKVIEEDFHSTVQQLESLTRMVPDLWYSDLSLDDWHEHLEEMRDCSFHLTELLDDNGMRLAGLLSKGEDNS